MSGKKSAKIEWQKNKWPKLSAKIEQQKLDFLPRGMGGLVGTAMPHVKLDDTNRLTFLAKKNQFG